jgi:glycerophosphoryl diester phosphodiesterase
LDSVAAAIAAGADVVEVDVRFTPDGVPVLSHDALSRTEGREPATLEDALDLVAATPGMRINLDLKVHAGLSPLILLLKKTNMINRAYFTGIEPENVSALHAQCPDIPFAVDYSRRWLPFRRRSTLRTLTQEAQDNGAFAFNLEHHSLTWRLLDVCAEASFPMHVWTVDTEADLRRLLGFGVSSITTRRVTLLQKLRDQMGV